MEASTGRREDPPRTLIVLAYVGFVSLGLPDAVVGVAWPSVRESFDKNQGALGLILLASGSGYFLSSFFSGRLTNALGIGVLLAASTALVSLSGFGFAFAPLWILFVGAAVFHGLGSGAIDAGLNGFAAARLSARHMNWLHACYCLGAMLGPILMTGVLTAGWSYRIGYGMLGVILLVLAIAFALTRPLWGNPREQAADASSTTTVSPLRQPAVWMQMAIFFVYTGLEVTVGQWTFTVLTEARGVDRAVAGTWVSVYWGSIGVGRLLLGFVVERVGIDRLLRFALLGVVLGAILFAIETPTWPTMAGLLLLGLSLAPVYPCLMTRTPERLGSSAATHAIGFQVGAAMIGAAVVPGLVGLIAERYGLTSIGYACVGLGGLLWLLHEILVHRHS